MRNIAGIGLMSRAAARIRRGSNFAVANHTSTSPSEFIVATWPLGCLHIQQASPWHFFHLIRYE